MVYRSGICVTSANSPKGVVPSKIRGMEENFKIHHIVDDNLHVTRHDVVCSRC